MSPQSLFILAQDAAPGPGGGGGFFLIMIAVLVLMMWFTGRSQRKRQKETQEMLSKLKAGDRVVTAGGIHGTIAHVKDDTLILKVADNIKIEFSRTSILNRLEDEAKKES